MLPQGAQNVCIEKHIGDSDRSRQRHRTHHISLSDGPLDLSSKAQARAVKAGKWDCVQQREEGTDGSGLGSHGG